MPYKSPHPCPTPGCPNLSASGKCDDCRRRIERRRGGSTARDYGARHQKMRLMVLARDPICRIRTHCTGAPSTDYDHIVPRSRGGQDAMENAQGACHECHSAKTAMEDGGFGR